MKTKLFLSVATIAILLASCAPTRDFVQGTEYGQEYKRIKSTTRYQMESVQILKDTFYVTSESKFLLKQITRRRTNPLTGDVVKLWSNYPFVLFNIPGVTYLELENQKAVTTPAKEVREKIFIETEKNLDLPLQLLNTLGQDWIVFPVKSNKVLPSLNISSDGEMLLICMVPLVEGTFIDVQVGCKNIYVESKNIYVLLPEFLKKPNHKTWEKGGQFNFQNLRNNQDSTIQSNTNVSVNSNQEWHIVRSGETFWSISKMHQISYQYLISINPQIQNPSQIQPGDRVRLRGEASTNSQRRQSNNSEKYYIVVSGDSLWKIAEKTGVSWKKLLELNNYDESLVVGQRVRVN